MNNTKYMQARERRLRKNGGIRHCEVCGTAEVFVMAKYGSRWLCYEHRPGGHATEEHHIAGLHRGAKLTIPANAHRALTAKMETMLPARLLARDRSIEEEAIAMAIGATFVSDAYVRRPDSPVAFVHAPRSAGKVIVPLRDFTVFRQRHPSGLWIELYVMNISVDDD